MIDEEMDVCRTFTDYADEVPVQFMELTIGPGHPWEEKRISELGLVRELLIVLILRSGENLIPGGDTLLETGDVLVIHSTSG